MLKNLQVQAVRRETNKMLETLRKLERIVTVILPIIEKYDGKKITKRLETELKELLPSNVFALIDTHDSISLQIWGDGILFEKRVHLFMGCRSPDHPERLDANRFVVSRWAAENVGWLNISNKIAQTEQKLANVDQIVSDYNKAVAALETAETALSGLNY
jgi:hypothetical protein